jgi:hypothetical protein
MIENITDLRITFRGASDIADRIGAFLILVEHPEATWEDLLMGLDDDQHEIIRNHAVGALYAALKQPGKKGDVPITARNEWERKIYDRGLALNGRIRECRGR